MKRIRYCVAAAIFAPLLCASAHGASLLGGARLTIAAPQQQPQDYLSSSEADKIRDAETPSDRLKLFMDFADDRLKKLKYTLAHPEEFPRNREEELNGLINAYSDCIDDASEIVDLAHQKQQDIRAGLKVVKAKSQDFLIYLQELSKTGAELDKYKENLDDAIEATQDAIDSATKAEKDISAPIRRPH
jgi:predicted ribosome quality control (RQC) complex YloA/Tae2 family protein